MAKPVSATRSKDIFAQAFNESATAMFDYGLKVRTHLLTESDLLPDEKRQVVELAKRLATTYPAVRAIQEVAGEIIAKHGEKAEVAG